MNIENLGHAYDLAAELNDLTGVRALVIRATPYPPEYSTQGGWQSSDQRKNYADETTWQAFIVATLRNIDERIAAIKEEAKDL